MLHRGDLTAARVTLLGRGLDPDAAPDQHALDGTPLAEFDLMALAQLWLAEGRTRQADLLLEDLARRAAGQGRQRRVFTLRLLQSHGRLEAGGGAALQTLSPLIDILPLARGRALSEAFSMRALRFAGSWIWRRARRMPGPAGAPGPRRGPIWTG